MMKVPQDAPFTAVLQFVCKEFKQNADTSAIITNDGVGINPAQVQHTYNARARAAHMRVHARLLFNESCELRVRSPAAPHRL